MSTFDLEPSTCADRFSYALINLLGEVVAVHLGDGSIVEGVFASKDDSSGLGILLLQARYRISPKHNHASSAGVLPRMLIEACDVIMIDAPRAPFKTSAAAAGHVSHAAREFGEMQRWADATDDGNEELEFDNHREGAWDQFATNRTKFGVKTSYSEDHYTTQLDRTKFTAEQQRKAAEIERSINSGQTRGIQHELERGGAMDIDEGAAFSDVGRGNQSLPESKPNAYVPPSKRKPGQGPTPTPSAPATKQPIHVDPSPQQPQQPQQLQNHQQQQQQQPLSPHSQAGRGLSAKAPEWRPPSANAQDDIVSSPVSPGVSAPAEVGPHGLTFLARIARKMEEHRRALRTHPHSVHTPEWPADDKYIEDDMRIPHNAYQGTSQVAPAPHAHSGYGGVGGGPSAMNPGNFGGGGGGGGFNGPQGGAGFNSHPHQGNMGYGGGGGGGGGGYGMGGGGHGGQFQNGPMGGNRMGLSRGGGGGGGVGPAEYGGGGGYSGPSSPQMPPPMSGGGSNMGRGRGHAGGLSMPHHGNMQPQQPSFQPQQQQQSPMQQQQQQQQQPMQQPEAPALAPGPKRGMGRGRGSGGMTAQHDAPPMPPDMPPQAPQGHPMPQHSGPPGASVAQAGGGRARRGRN